MEATYKNTSILKNIKLPNMQTKEISTSPISVSTIISIKTTRCLFLLLFCLISAQALAQSGESYQKRTPYDNAPDRFNMEQDGKKMTADDFDKWMTSRGIRVAGRQSTRARGSYQTSQMQIAQPARVLQTPEQAQYAQIQWERATQQEEIQRKRQEANDIAVREQQARRHANIASARNTNERASQINTSDNKVANIERPSIQTVSRPGAKYTNDERRRKQELYEMQQKVTKNNPTNELIRSVSSKEQNEQVAVASSANTNITTKNAAKYTTEQRQYLQEMYVKEQAEKSKVINYSSQINNEKSKNLVIITDIAVLNN